ncbi:MAG: hypothetical protein COA45_05090 [Zetaproteobacteria bacterium]|nr:MAG: hypothetical protein COA45_05090 [Zetaproteobacteria bacterium]
MPESKQDMLTRYFNRAIEYPNVNHDDFKESYIIAVGKDEAEKADPAMIVSDSDFSFASSGKSIRLAGATENVDTYEVTIKKVDGEEVTLHDRVALVGFGSNSAPEILKTKFNDFVTDTKNPEDNQIVVMQGNLQSHVVVAAAFYSDIGPVPATLHRKEGDSASVTIGFYTKAQAEQMTGTEQSYAGVELDTEIILKGGTAVEKPLAYVAVWGALTNEDGELMANPSIPQQTDLPEVSTREVIEYAMSITNPEMDDIKPYIEGHSMGLPMLSDVEIAEKEKTRYIRTDILAEHSTPSNVIGTLIFPPSIYEDTPSANAPRPTFSAETENDTSIENIPDLG